MPDLLFTTYPTNGEPERMAFYVGQCTFCSEGNIQGSFTPFLVIKGNIHRTWSTAWEGFLLGFGVFWMVIYYGEWFIRCMLVRKATFSLVFVYIGLWDYTSKLPWKIDRYIVIQLTQFSSKFEVEYLTFIPLKSYLLEFQIWRHTSFFIRSVSLRLCRPLSLSLDLYF